MVAILHNAAMDLWDVATEEDAAQMWEEARAIASAHPRRLPNRITTWCDFPRTSAQRVTENE